MRQAGTGPDAVELLLPGDVLEAQALHRLAKMGLGQRDQGGGRIEGGDAVAQVSKGSCVAPGAAIGVENLCLVSQRRQEAATNAVMSTSTFRLSEVSACG